MLSKLQIFKKTYILLIGCLFSFSLSSCDPEDAHTPSELYSMWIINDLGHTVYIQTNISETMESVVSSSNYALHELKPDDSYYFIKDKFYSNNNNPFQTIWDRILINAEANKMEVFLRIFKDDSEEPRLMKEWLYSKRDSDVNSIFSEANWKVECQDDSNTYDYTVHHRTWSFSLSNNI